MRRRFAVLGFAGIVFSVAAGLAILPSETSEAASAEATFIVPADDGYGVAECASSDCGKVIADQWCLAQGFARSESFGPAEPAEVTGSIKGRLARATLTDARPFSITCSR